MTFLVQLSSFPISTNVIWCDDMQAGPGSINPTTNPLKAEAKSCSQCYTRAHWRSWELTEWKLVSVVGRVLLAWCCHPWKELCSSVSMGTSFHQYIPPPDAGLSCMSRSCPAVGSLFLTIHCSSWIPTEQLSVHLPSRHTREALMGIRVLRSQSKGEVDPGMELIFKTSSSRAWPIHLPARSL